MMLTVCPGDCNVQVDDDVIVDVKALAAYLRERRTSGNLYMVCGDFAVSISASAPHAGVAVNFHHPSAVPLLNNELQCLRCIATGLHEVGRGADGQEVQVV